MEPYEIAQEGARWVFKNGIRGAYVFVRTPTGYATYGTAARGMNILFRRELTFEDGVEVVHIPEAESTSVFYTLTLVSITPMLATMTETGYLSVSFLR